VTPPHTHTSTHHRPGALLVFAEHRYEPLSHPALCGPHSQRCLAYCTTAQAIADWVSIIAALRARHTARAPVVAFGGSYGGMLAGWLRIKYPSVVDGAIAASAPIWQLAGTVARETLDMQAVAMTRGVSAAGGATDRCRHTLRSRTLTLTRTLPLPLTRCRHILRCRTLTLTLTPLTLPLPRCRDNLRALPLTLTLALPRCRDNLRVAWPLLREAGRSAALG